MKKRFFVCLFVLTALAALLPMTVSAASGTMDFSVISTECTLGIDDTVTVPVNVTINPGYTLGTVAVTWDTSAMSLSEVVYTDLAPNASSPAVTDFTDGIYYISFGDPAAAQDFTGTGTFFKLVFAINQDAQPGSYNVTFAGDASGIYNNSLENIGATFQSAKVKLLGAPEITEQPQSFSGNIGDAVSFSVKAEGVELTYQWQLSDDQGANWRNSSTKTATYATKLSATNNGRYVRCLVTDKYGRTALSDAASMTAPTPLKITAQPVNAVGAIGDPVKFSVTAQGDELTYQWQLSDDQGKNWRNSSNKTANYSTTLSETNNGRYVRCVVTDKYGSSVNSDAASMKVGTAFAITITQQPVNATGAIGDLVKFSVKATGDTLTYQWQLSDDQGKNWRNSSNKTAEYATTLSETNNGRYVRCVVSDKNGNSVNSDAASMKVATSTTFALTKQPADATGAIGDLVKFSVAATGEGLTYQWQLSDDQGKNWRNSSNTTNQYATTLSETNNGRYVRCIVTDKNSNTLTSNAASMKVSGSTSTTLAITEHPAPVTALKGDLVTFKVKATGEGITYQWQLSDDQGKTWRNSKATTASYSTTLSETNTGRYIRVIVYDKNGAKKTSNAAYMKISSLAITGQPVNATGNVGDLVTFTVTAKGPGITYQWQLSDDKGTTWRNSKNTTASYSTTLSDANNGRYVRCIVTDKYGNSVNSDAASMKLAK